MATLDVTAASSSISLDQYGRAQELERCLVDAGLPAELAPVENGEAEVTWVDGHEVLARDSEQWTTVLEGPAGEVDPVTHEAFMGVNADPVTGLLAPALWIDGVDHTATWAGCLESSQYSNPSAAYEPDPGELLLGSQRQAEAANEWMACAREHGLEGLEDVAADSSGMAPGPHAEIPLQTEPGLLTSVVEACPTFNEDYFRRVLDGDPTLEDDVSAGRISPNPLVLVEQPADLQDEGHDYGSTEEDRRFEELNAILYEDEAEFGERYGAEQAQQNIGGQGHGGEVE
ncbi:MAG: hypothetical protein LBK28_02720 [Propionibacteriaceae bacterium]|nr:hypothetical protein [Propionibacteriaceae bacterium]